MTSSSSQLSYNKHTSGSKITTLAIVVNSYLSINPTIYPNWFVSISLPVCLLVLLVHSYLSIYLSISVDLYASVCLSVHPSSFVSLSHSLCIYQSIIIDFLRQSIRLCTCPTQHLSLSLSIYIYICRLICIRLWLSAGASELIHIYLSIYLSTKIFWISPSNCVPVQPIIFISIYLSISQSL